MVERSDAAWMFLARSPLNVASITFEIATVREIGIVFREDGALGIHSLVMSPEARPFIVTTHSARGVCAHGP